MIPSIHLSEAENKSITLKDWEEFIGFCLGMAQIFIVDAHKKKKKTTRKKREAKEQTSDIDGVVYSKRRIVGMYIFSIG